MGRTEDYVPKTNIFGLDVAGFEAYFGWEAAGDQEAGTGAFARHRLLPLQLLSPFDLQAGLGVDTLQRNEPQPLGGRGTSARDALQLLALSEPLPASVCLLFFSDSLIL